MSVSERVGRIMSVERWIGILLDVVIVIATVALTAVLCSFVLWMAVFVLKIIWIWILF